METSKNNQLEVIEVPASGKTTRIGGAWCLVFVYSTSGNFLLKGYIKECEEYIESKGWKCWAIFKLYYQKRSRTIIRTYKCGFEIREPFLLDKKRTSKDYKFVIYQKNNYDDRIYIKRLPGKFVNFNIKNNI